MSKKLGIKRDSQIAQAVIEMALVIPIMLTLVAGFVALMLQVVRQVQLETAVNLAAQSAISAPVNDLTNSCKYATTAFVKTITPNANANTYTAGCNSPIGPREFRINNINPTSYFHVQVFDCTDEIPAGNSSSPTYFTDPGNGNNSGVQIQVTCAAIADIDYSNTPLAWAVLWHPTIVVGATVSPTNNRQCPTCP